MFVVSKQFHLAQEIVVSGLGRSYSVQYTYILTYIYMSSAVSRHSDSYTHNIRVSWSKREQPPCTQTHQPATVLMVPRQRRGGRGGGAFKSSHEKRFAMKPSIVGSDSAPRLHVFDDYCSGMINQWGINRLKSSKLRKKKGVCLFSWANGP